MSSVMEKDGAMCILSFLPLTPHPPDSAWGNTRLDTENLQQDVSTLVNAERRGLGNPEGKWHRRMGNSKSHSVFSGHLAWGGAAV